MFVRLLNEADAAAHRALRIRSIQGSPQLSSPQIVRELAIYQRIGAGALMAHAAGGTRVWGAFDRERLAGVVAVTRETGAHPLAGGFHLWGLYVRPEDRGGSASHALMSTALAWCRQRPCNQGVTLHAHRGNARSEEHTSELQSLLRISSAVFCLKQKHHTQ